MKTTKEGVEGFGEKRLEDWRSGAIDLIDIRLDRQTRGLRCQKDMESRIERA